MAFDPDKYLASAPAFDPDAYLRATSGGIPGPRTPLPDQIPGNQPVGQAAPSALTFGNILSTAVERPLEVLEVPVALGANMIGGIPTYLAGAFGPKVQQAVAKEVMYQPRGQLARETLEAVGKGFEESKLPPYMPAVTAPGMLQQSLRPATRALTDAGQAAAATSAEALAQPFVRRAITKGQENLAKSYQNAAILDAAQARERLGAVVNPALSNPTTSNVVKGALTGTSGKDAWFSKKNEGLWIDKAKEVIGAEKNSVLNDAAIETALDKASKPYDAVKGIVMQPTDEVVASLEAARIPETISGEKSAAAVNNLVNRAQEMLSQGRSGADVLLDIRQLRRDANSIFQSQKAGMAPDPAKVAEAEASIKIANTLEMLIDANAPDMQTLEGIRKARTKLAQIFDVDRATNKVTGRVDPMEFAKMLAEGKQLTGPLKDMGMFAGVFPSNAVVSTGAAPALPSLSRSGPAGTMGYAAGAATGISPIATSVGGAGIGGALSGLVARRMATPQYQAAYAMPRDYRPPINQLRPAEPVYAPGQPVPYDWSRATAPNWTPGAAEGPVVQFGAEAPPTVNMLGYGGTMETLAAEKARAAQMSRTLGQQAEAQAAVAEAAANMGKRTTNRAMNLEWDPVAQVYREAAPQGAGGVVGGVTPLESAVAKMSGQVLPETTGTIYTTTRVAPKTGAEPYTRITRKGGETAFERQGQAFAMTAEEKIAWNKAKADLAEVMPGMKSLPDEAIATKMMDRDFAAQAVANARAKAEQLALREAKLAEQLANRDNLRLMAREIEAKNKELAKIRADRQRMMDLAEQMDESLRASRPVSAGGQGPKTRAHQRNKLNMLSDQEALNKLLEK